MVSSKNLKKSYKLAAKRVNAAKIRGRLSSIISLINKIRRTIVKKAYLFTQSHPFRAFFTVLGIFLILMILGNVVFGPKPSKTTEVAAAKEVHIFQIGKAPKITYQGKVEKSGVVKIVAQMPGIVSGVNVSEGQQVGMGTNIVSLATNYSGGNVMSVSRELASVQYQNAKDTYDTQKDIISKQRAVADKSRDNGSLMRDIANTSSSSTSDLIALDQQIVDSLQASVDSAPDAATKLQAQSALAQAKSGLIQLQSSYQSLQIQTNSNSVDLANLSHDLAVKQLDLQERALQTGLSVASLQLRMAQINEASMYPSSPFAGTVDRVFVNVGDNVNPGTVLAQISGASQHVKVVVNVPEKIARNISQVEPSVLHVNGKSVEAYPDYVSLDATAGTLYSVVYDLEDAPPAGITDASFVEVEIPVGTPDASNLDPFVPLDSVIQTQEEAQVFIADSKNIARAKKVTLGDIQGRFVEVLSGLPENATIILDRNVIEGDKIKVIR